MVEYYNQAAEAVLKTLETHPGKGLSDAESKKRLEQYGPNELEAKKKLNPILLFLGQFKSFIIYILLFAVVISIISHEVVDAVVILLILLFNAVFGFIQEYKAEKAIDALKKLSGFKAKVIRNGKTIEIDAKDLVPGDIMFVEEGNKIPADGRLLEAARLQISEASLTGESVPVSKKADAIKGELTVADRKNMIFSGTAVNSGKGLAVITSTGMNTEMGKIAGMLAEVEDELTPLQQKLESLGKIIGIATIIICIIVFAFGVWSEGKAIPLLLAGDFLGFVFAAKVWFLTSVSLAVAAVPEGLPAIVTIALAIGVTKMGKRNALIRKLPSVETLGETTVICSDKTGTLTKNEMTVRVAYTFGRELKVSGEGYDPKDGRIEGKLDKDAELLFRCGALCNDSILRKENNKYNIVGDPTEGALVVSAAKAYPEYTTLRDKFKKGPEEPFDSIRKMMSVAYQDPKTKKALVYTKGATEQVLKHCTKILIKGKVVKLTAEHKKKILAQNVEYASQALRVLGFAYKEHKKGTQLERDLTFVGLQGMIDPPHKEVPGAIARCKKAGIRVVMITGDNVHTAVGIAKEIGIHGESMNGADFDKLNEAGKRKAIKNCNIFARVEPRHKMEIVEMLQKEDQVVAMTGDGVNDAPAIKKADLGIAMGITGTDVAKEASAMVLQDDNFTSIVNAIEEGRGIYANITKFVNYLLSCNMGEIFVIFVAILMGLPLPMTAIMLLWLNLVTDGLPALALSVDPNPNDLMLKPPKEKKEGIMNKSMAFNIFYVSVLITIGVLFLFKWGMAQYAGEENMLAHIQTIAFCAIVVMEIVRLQAIRSEFNLGVFSNKHLVLAVLVSCMLQLAVVYTGLSQFFGTVPLTVTDWVMILLVSAVVLVFNTIGNRIKSKIGWFQQN